MSLFKRIIAITTLILVGLSGRAQLVPTNAAPYNSATYLVQNILIGQGVSVSNITYTGNANAIGYFTAPNTNLGLDSGIVMTSGSIYNTPGPNTSGSSGSNNGASGDSLLNDYSGQTTYDAAILEFDFVAVSDTLQFNYVFGSEEYPEFVGPPCGTSNFNDVFGFFLTGPNPNGGTYNDQNLATVGTSPLIVSINNLNCQCFSSYYVCNDPNNTNQAPANQCATVYGCPSSSVGTTVAYDGFTLVMQVYSPVVCGQTYHIKMAIADAGDGIYDSGIFIEAKSFKGPSLLMVTQTDSTGNTLDTALIEGCTSTGLEFIRTGNWDDTIAVPLYYAGTADNGIDYVQLPDTIFIMPDSGSYILDIQSIFDNNFEGTETILIYSDSVFTDCSVFPPDTLVFTITDQPDLVVTGLSDTTLGCPGDAVDFNVSINGGITPYNYAWGDGSTQLSRTFSPSSDLQLTFFATDSCGNQVYEDTVMITVPPDIPIGMDLRDTLLCEGEVLTLNPGVIGGYQPLQFTWQDGSTDSILIDVPTTSGWYWLQVDDLCGFSRRDSMFLDLSPMPDPNYNYLAYPDQSVQFTNASLNANIYAWDFGDGSGLNFDLNPVHIYDAGGTYTVWLYAENNDGCQDSIARLVDVIPVFHLYIPNAFSPNGDQMNDCFEVVGEGFTQYTIEIFDRWGKMVYYSESISECWDGNFEGEEAEAGTYTYKIKLILPLEAEPYSERGYLLLMR